MVNEKKVTAIITAGGRGVRIGGDVPKQFLHIAGRPILEHTLENFKSTGLVGEVVLVVRADAASAQVAWLVDSAAALMPALDDPLPPEAVHD